MRYMESYFGQCVKHSTCGLRKGDRPPLGKLRKCFTHNILMVDYNVHKGSMANRAWTYKDKLFWVRMAFGWVCFGVLILVKYKMQ